MRKIAWAWRRDLAALPNESGGWIVRDPLSERFVFMYEHELLAGRLLDGNQTVEGWCASVRRSYPDRQVAVESLTMFLQRLISQNLLVATHPAIIRPVEQSGKSNLLSKLPTRFLRLQIPLFNPTPLLNHIRPVINALFSRLSFVLYAMILLTGCVLLLSQFREFRMSVPALDSLSTRDSLLTLLTIFCVIKLFHEFSHAAACHYFGGHCRTIGLMFLVFTPIAYSDVSDSWRLSRRRRIAVASAGVVAEFVLASICVILWTVATPGFTRGVLTYVIILCTLQTVLFNANPLLRFDGYFVLSDLIGIPNLYQQSSIYVSSVAKRLLFGFHQANYLRFSNRRLLLLTYGILALAYRTIMAFAIVQFLSRFLMTIGQRNLGTFAGLTLMASFLGWPFIRFVRTTGKQMERSGLSKQFAYRLGFLALAVATILFWPIDSTVIAPCVFLPHGQPVYVNQPGWLVASARYGDEVAAGSSVAKLSNHNMQFQQLKLEAQRNELQVLLSELEKQPSSEKNSLIATRENLAALEVQIALEEQNVKQLAIASPESGSLLEPESYYATQRSMELGDWQGVPLADANVGAYFARGTILGYVGSHRRRRIAAYVDENDIRTLTRNDSISVLSLDGNQSVYTTVIDDFGRINASHVHQSIDAAGMNPWGRQDTERTVMRISAIVEGDVIPSLFSVGKVKITGPKTTLWNRGWNYLKSEFSVVFN